MNGSPGASALQTVSAEDHAHITLSGPINLMINGCSKRDNRVTYRCCISLLLVLSASIVSTLGADSPTNLLSKIEVTAIVNPPMTGRVWLVDHRFDPPRKYRLKVGEATNGITVTRIDLERGVVELVLGGKTNSVGFVDQKRK